MKKTLEKPSETATPSEQGQSLDEFLKEIERKVTMAKELNSIRVLLAERAEELRKLQKELADVNNDESAQDSFRSDDLEDQIAEKISEIEELNKEWGNLFFAIKLKEAEEKDKQNLRIN